MPNIHCNSRLRERQQYRVAFRRMAREHRRRVRQDQESWDEAGASVHIERASYPRRKLFAKPWSMFYARAGSENKEAPHERPHASQD